MFQIIILKKVNQFINKLPNAEKVREKLGRLKDFNSDNNLRLDIERFKGKSKNRYRIRIGEIRYIFEVVEDKIFIDTANYRGRVY
ncbi:hypothetical protein CMI42_00175 [Candidatus Pacearchaeota archaeon]|nr:hypothetical protein [Candidatus Pacearchaeota archaeon]